MNRIKALRKEKKLKQTDLAAILNISQGTLSSWETGRYDIGNDDLKKLAAFFGVTTDYILGQTDISQLPGYLGPVVENKKIPIIGSVKCGPDGLAFEYIDGCVSSIFISMYFRWSYIEKRLKRSEPLTLYFFILLPPLLLCVTHHTSGVRLKQVD